MNQTRIALKTFCILLSVVVLGVSGTTSVLAQEQAAEKSLYERLGGAYSIATVVDDFIERLLVNDILNANPAINKARTDVPKAGLKYHVTEMVCQATGGPQKYSGRTMKESHKHLNITEAEWDAMAADFKKTLAKFNVPEKEQNELFTIIESTKPDIVMSSKTSKQ
ncbi:group 1 truncated hemoglobin [candidate division KSB1 bacterium]|nr:group 1 truncated hemoglobin [candidate division KSB1 bacterium]